jgi:FSR family fosmidomycin resistance protein-like MFS transporter
LSETADAHGERTVPAASRRTLATTSSVHFVHDGIGDALYVLLPFWAQAFGLSYAEVGTLRSAYSAALAFLQVPAGMLGERLSERALLAGGTVLAGLAFALLATSQGYAMVGGLILLAGVGSSVQHPLASTIIARSCAPSARRAALGVYNFSGDVGKMTVTAAMGVGVIALGWQASVVIYGMVVAGVGVLAFLGLHRLAKPEQLPSAKADGAPRPAGWGFTNRKGFALLSSIQLVDSACRTGLLTFLPFLLISKGASAASIGFGLSLVFIGGALGKLVCGLLAERMGILRTVILTEIATGLAILAVVASPLALAMVLLMPLGVALNGTSSVLYGTVAEFVRDDRQGRAFGLFYTLGSAAGATAPFAFGLISDLTSVPTALVLVAMLALATVPIALALAPHVSKAGPDAGRG